MQHRFSSLFRIRNLEFVSLSSFICGLCVGFHVDGQHIRVRSVLTFGGDRHRRGTVTRVEHAVARSVYARIQPSDGVSGFTDPHPSPRVSDGMYRTRVCTGNYLRIGYYFIWRLISLLGMCVVLQEVAKKWTGYFVLRSFSLENSLSTYKWYIIPWTAVSIF